jgi:hypothetical protein
LKCTRLMSTDWIPSKPLNLVPNTCKDRTLEKMTLILPCHTRRHIAKISDQWPFS